MYASIKEKWKHYQINVYIFSIQLNFRFIKSPVWHRKSPVTGHEPDSKNYLVWEPDLMFVTHLFLGFELCGWYASIGDKRWGKVILADENITWRFIARLLQSKLARIIDWFQSFYSSHKVSTKLEWVKEWWQVSHFFCNFCDYSPYYCSRWHWLAWNFERYFLSQKLSFFITDSDLFYNDSENFEYLTRSFSEIPTNH